MSAINEPTGNLLVTGPCSTFWTLYNNERSWQSICICEAVLQYLQ